jgi:hypothetical protein
MDDCRKQLLNCISEQMVYPGAENSRAPSFTCYFFATPHRTKNMEYTQQNEEAPISQSNFRAEDGLATGRSNSLYEGVVIPLASLFAVFLFMLGAMVITR